MATNELSQSQRGEYSENGTRFVRSAQGHLEALNAAAAKPDPSDLHRIAKEAARSGNVAALKYAISLGAEPSRMILPALSIDNPDSLVCLLDAGLDVNYRIPGYTGTPLTGSAAFAKVELIKALLSHGADPNLENCGWGQFQLKPIAAAAQGLSKDEDAAEAIKALLEGGAKWEGSAALQLAAKDGKLECVKLLVGRGADVGEIVTKVEEQGALKLAEERGADEVASVLREHGAKV